MNKLLGKEEDRKGLVICANAPAGEEEPIALVDDRGGAVQAQANS